MVLVFYTLHRGNFRGTNDNRIRGYSKILKSKKMCEVLRKFNQGIPHAAQPTQGPMNAVMLRQLSQGKLLRSNSCSATTQYIFLNLAGGSLGQFSDKRDRPGYFEVCHVVANEGAQLVFCRALSRLEHDKRVR